jgi:hypothetical protein
LTSISKHQRNACDGFATERDDWNEKDDHVHVTYLPTALMLLPRIIAAQEATGAEPQYVGTVYWLDSVQGKAAALEHQQLSSQTKVKAMGYGGARAMLSFKGRTSSVRLTSEQQVFIVRLDTEGLNPGLMIGLNVLKTTKNAREITTASAGFMGMGAKTAAGETAIPLRFEKYGGHSFKIIPAERLAPGEYVIWTKPTGHLGYLFGVD